MPNFVNGTIALLVILIITVGIIPSAPIDPNFLNTTQLTHLTPIKQKTEAAKNITFFSTPNSGSNVRTAESMGDLVLRLSSTGVPKDSLTAYNIISTCQRIQFDFDKREIENAVTRDEIEASCSGITKSQMQEVEKYLDIAVAGHAPGALLARFNAGPSGRLRSGEFEMHHDDPLLVEWKKNMVGELAKDAHRNGDLQTLNTLSHIYANGIFVDKNPALALSYRFAMLEIAKTSRDPAVRANIPALERLLLLQPNKAPERAIENAQTSVHKIANSCCIR
jgi:hypothetical protein